MKRLESIMAGNLDPVLRTTSVLSRLWGLYLYQYNMGLPVFYARLNVYLKRVKDSGEEENISDYKGNLLKALDKDNLSWQRLCQGMSFIAPAGYDFKIHIKIGEVELDKSVSLGYCHKKDMGNHLAEMWTAVKEAFPDRYKDWKKLADHYVKNNTNEPEKKHSSFGSNLKSRLSNSTITWKVFYLGIMVLSPDVFIVKVSANDIETKIKVKG